MSACCDCRAIDHHFGASRAAAELEAYVRQGPTGTTRLILRSLDQLPVRIESLLDIGAGVGVLHHELLHSRARSAVHVEAAQAYLEAARAESVRRGHTDRVRFLHGDFLTFAPSLESADLVTMDRVICCYPEFEPLVRASVATARRCYAISYPHDRWYVRAHTVGQNIKRRWAGNRFRTFVHSPARVRVLMEEGGLRVFQRRRTLVWEVLVGIRGDAA